MKHILPVERTLYFALIQQHVTYGILATGKASQSVIHKAEVLQKRAIRIINKATYNSHTEALFKQSNVLKLKNWYEYQSLLFMYAFAKIRLPHSFGNSFKCNPESLSHPLTFLSACGTWYIDFLSTIYLFTIFFSNLDQVDAHCVK